MIYTTSGNKQQRAINAEDVKEQIAGLMLFNKSEQVQDVLKQLLADIDELPTLDTINGKKMRRAYYPRVMVRDNCDEIAEPLQIGGNSHHWLQVCHTRDGSHLSFLNVQCMAGTEYADEGYTFVGEKLFEKMGDDTELVPFDMVYVEEGAEKNVH